MKDIEQFRKDLFSKSLKDFSTPPHLLDHSIANKRERYEVGRSEIPLPALVEFLFKMLLGFPAYGPAEKLRWEILFQFQNIPCAFALEKSGLHLYISCNARRTAEETNQLKKEIVRKVQKAIRQVEKILRPFSEEQLAQNNVTIDNHSHRLKERYEYFRLKATETAYPVDIRSQGLAGVLNNQVKNKKTLLFNSVAMLDAYFSYLEHLFVLLAPLRLDDFKIVDFIFNKKLTDKFDLLFKLKENKKAKGYHDKLLKIKEEFRNYFAHGNFEKKGASLYIHLPHIGAIPAQLSKAGNNPHFEFFPINNETFENICIFIDDFNSWLSSSASGVANEIQIIGSGLSMPCDKKSILEMKEAIKTPESLEAYLRHESEMCDKHDNMDY